MKKVLCLLLIVLLSSTISFEKAAAVQLSYYGSGSYVDYAPVEPLDGIKFYVDYSAISKYGSGAFSSAFDWNGNYSANVAMIAQYPASWSSYPTSFLIQVSTTLLNGVYGDTYYFNAAGTCINPYYTFPMDQNGLYKCSIGLTSREHLFWKNGSVCSEYLEKTIIHEVGHVFLLKHPANVNYAFSVMNQGLPNNSTIASSVTSLDRWNITEKWGY